jgi:hypothetical protein
MALLSLIEVPLAKVGAEWYLFGAAGLVSLVAFGTLIFAPALSSFSRPWEKVAAGVLSIFVLVALVLVGLAVGLIIFYNWDTISNKI